MFPILKNSIILKIMEEVNIPLTEMELTEPGRCKERVREVFVHLVSVRLPIIGMRFVFVVGGEGGGVLLSVFCNCTIYYYTL